MTATVLDASVVLATILGEPGHDHVLGLERPHHISSVNLAEVYARLTDHAMPVRDIDRALGLLQLEVVDFTRDHARISAELRPETKRAGLSLGDRACLALAVALDGTAYTADRAWTTLDLPATVTCIR